MEGYLGEIRAFAGANVPANWMLCNGAILNSSIYPQLFALIGNAYGGSSPKTFALPDFRGRLLIDQGAGPGLTQRVVGQTGGTERVALAAAELPSHNHNVKVSMSGMPVVVPSPSTNLGSMTSPGGAVVGYLPGSATGLTDAVMDASTIQPAGNGGYHNNMMPCQPVNFMICINGLWPPRSS